MRNEARKSVALQGMVAGRRGVRGAWTCIAAAGLIGGCGGGNGAKPGSPDRLDWSHAAALARAQTCDDALETFRVAARTQMEIELANSRRCMLDREGCITYAGGGAPPVTLSPDNGAVAGIDQLDSVKTDGTHLYAIVGGELVVLASWPASATAVVARVVLPAGDQRGLYLAAGTTVVVLTAVESADAVAAREATGSPWGYELPRPDVTIASVIDVSNPSAPVVTARKGFGGNLVASRRVDGRAFLALTARVEVPGLRLVPEGIWEIAPEAREAAFEALHASNVAAIDAVTIDRWLPHSVTIGEDGSIGERGAPLNGCTDVYATNLHAGSGYLTIATVDVTSGESLGASTIAGEWGYAVASREALYLAGTRGDTWLFADQADEAVETQIHKFALTDSVARYAASAKVTGWMQDEYAMDEYGGNLRVATASESFLAPDSVIWESRVTVLAEQDGVLVEQGAVTENEQGHTLAGTRFVGDKGFAAAADGFDVLDLSDPLAPTIAGTLDLRGEVSYLRALDAGHVLAVGSITNEAGEGTGLQLAIFDVGDPRAPTVTHRETIDHALAWNAYDVDRNSFRWVAERDLFLVPVVYPGPEANSHRSELVAYQVTPSGVTPLGAASHEDLLDALVGGPVCGEARLGVDTIRRSVVIDDFVYSFSALGVAVHDARALDAGAVAELQLVDETLAASWAETLRCGDVPTDAPSDGAR